MFMLMTLLLASLPPEPLSVLFSTPIAVLLHMLTTIAVFAAVSTFVPIAMPSLLGPVVSLRTILMPLTPRCGFAILDGRRSPAGMAISRWPPWGLCKCRRRRQKNNRRQTKNRSPQHFQLLFDARLGCRFAPH
jgi:hypothetical protein